MENVYYSPARLIRDLLSAPDNSKYEIQIGFVAKDFYNWIFKKAKFKDFQVSRNPVIYYLQSIIANVKSPDKIQKHLHVRIESDTYYIYVFPRYVRIIMEGKEHTKHRTIVA
jgi:hypothetical protein